MNFSYCTKRKLADRFFYFVWFKINLLLCENNFSNHESKRNLEKIWGNLCQSRHSKNLCFMRIVFYSNSYWKFGNNKRQYENEITNRYAMKPCLFDIERNVEWIRFSYWYCTSLWTKFKFSLNRSLKEHDVLTDIYLYHTTMFYCYLNFVKSTLERKCFNVGNKKAWYHKYCFSYLENKEIY